MFCAVLCYTCYDKEISNIKYVGADIELHTIFMKVITVLSSLPWQVILCRDDIDYEHMKTTQPPKVNVRSFLCQMSNIMCRSMVAML